MKLADRPRWDVTGVSRSPQPVAKAQLSTSQLATLTRREWDEPPSAERLLHILQVANAALASGAR